MGRRSRFVYFVRRRYDPALGGMEDGSTNRRRPEAVTYCLPLPDVPQKVCDALKRHFLDDRSVQVIEDRRRGERRSSDDRRLGDVGTDLDRRLIMSLYGRRVGERRAEVEPCEAPPLPRKLQGWADRIVFLRRFPPAVETIDDHEDLRLVIRLQSGDIEAFNRLYERYLVRVCVYAEAALGDSHEAEDIAHEVLLKMLNAVPGYTIRGIPFRIWIFRVLRNQIRDHLAKRSRVVLEDPAAVADKIETATPLELELFERLSEHDFGKLVEPLTEVQRQVIVLRYLLGYSNADCARLLGRTPGAIRQNHYLALRALEPLLSKPASPDPASLGREDRQPMRRLIVPKMIGPGGFTLLPAWTPRGAWGY